MNKETKIKIKKYIINFFGATGYLIIVLQWLWIFMLYFDPIKDFVTSISKDNSPVSQPSISLEPNILLVIMAGIITAVMIILTIYTLIKMPGILIKNSKKVVVKTAKAAAPMVLKYQHKKDSPKNRIKLTLQLIIIIKLTLIILPIILTILSQLTENQTFDFRISIYVSSFLAGFSFILFVFQYLFAHLFAIDRQEI